MLKFDLAYETCAKVFLTELIKHFTNGTCKCVRTEELLRASELPGWTKMAGVPPVTGRAGVQLSANAKWNDSISFVMIMIMMMMKM